MTKEDLAKQIEMEKKQIKITEQETERQFKQLNADANHRIGMSMGRIEIYEKLMAELETDVNMAKVEKRLEKVANAS